MDCFVALLLAMTLFHGVIASVAKQSMRAVESLLPQHQAEIR
jgi:hypothetical protein